MSYFRSQNRQTTKQCAHPGLVGTMPRRPMVTTQIFNASIHVVAPEAAAAADVLYPMPTWSEKTLQLYPCHPGFFDDGIDAQGDVLCAPCPAGQYRDLTLLTCSPCPPGEFAEQPGSAACRVANFQEPNLERRA